MMGLKHSFAYLAVALFWLAPRSLTGYASASDTSSPRFWLARVVAIADQNTDPKIAANEYSVIAPLQARAGDLAGMRSSLQKVRAAEPGLAPKERFYFLMAELESYGRAMDETAFRARLDELRKVRETDPKAVNNYSVVTKLCDCGRLDDALVWAELSADPGDRWGNLSKVAEAQAKAGQAEACARTLGLAELDADRAARASPSDEDYIWNELAMAAAAARDTKRVGRFAVHLKPDTAASVYAELAANAWDAGNKAEYAAELKTAIALAGRIDRRDGASYDLASCYGTIAKLQAATADAPGVSATEAAFPIGRDLSKQTIALEEFYDNMAGAYAILGDGAKVADRLKKAREVPESANKAGKAIDGVLNEMRATFAPPYPPILAALARKGKIDVASTLAADAPLAQRDGAMIALALVYAQVGRADDAIKLLKARDADEIQLTLFSMGKAIGRSGKLGAWLSYADALKSAVDRANAYLGTAEGLLDGAEGKEPKP